MVVVDPSPALVLGFGRHVTGRFRFRRKKEKRATRSDRVINSYDGFFRRAAVGAMRIPRIANADVKDVRPDISVIFGQKIMSRP